MKNLISNKKARQNYEILDTFEAGLVLFGYEVKSIKLGRAKLDGSHVIIRGGEAFLVNSSVAPYQPANMPKSYDPERPRKLLLSKKELKELEVKSDQVGLTLVPIRLYNNDPRLKLEVAVARGKKKHDKRESLKQRDSKRAIDRILKNQD
ncbi:MAG: SsrA-binding protein [Candidatus Azotimanducaceae bacterium]|jgi:SsrA-binding protein